MIKKDQTVRGLGERGLIRWFQELITPFNEALLSGMEDAVAVPLDKQALVVNTDMLVASTDVLPGMSAGEIAWKAGVMGLSDLAAKGVLPLGIVASLGFPESTEANFAAAVVSGLNRVSREHDTYYLGGDTNQCIELVINCTAFGTAPKTQLVRRKGAALGDVIAVTGEFGYTGTLLKAIYHDLQEPRQLLAQIREKALRPHARLREGRILAQKGVVSAAIDSSDGLAWSLHELAAASQVGFYIESLPVPSICTQFAAANDLDTADLALYGGEEFELVVTIPSAKWKNAHHSVESVGGQLIPIGKVVEEQEKRLIISGEERVIEPKGYEHFT
ncbi:MAG: thiamine-phosphate kinase [Candidatus Hodarchaeota archaeon]